MSRPDLLALTPDSLAALANMGLVKRAQRELEAGQGPTLVEAEDGTVTGTFADGIIATLPPKTALQTAPCTCGSLTICRHRVAVVLAYAKMAPTDSSPSIPPDWSPSAFTNDELKKVLGERAVERGREILKHGPVVVECKRPQDSTQRHEAKLPSSAVQFLAPSDLAFARCDCKLGRECEHVAVAVWAFRVADEEHPGDAVCHVQLTPDHASERKKSAKAKADSKVKAETKAKKSGAPLPQEAMVESSKLVSEILLTGITHLHEASKQHFARAHDAALAAGTTWPLTIIDEIEESWHAYQARSARYQPEALASLLAETTARHWASRGSKVLPEAYVLGVGEARETELGHTRLISLGARLTAQDRERTATIFMADPDAGAVFAFSKKFTYAEKDSPEDGAALGHRPIETGVSIARMATSQLVSRVLKRSAKRELHFTSSKAATTAGATTLTEQTPDWAKLPASIRVDSIAAYTNEIKERPPTLLRPRVVADAMRVVPIGEVGPMTYQAGAQRLIIPLTDPNGGEFILSKTFRQSAPQALDCVAHALSNHRETPVQYIAGDLYFGPLGLEMHPVGMVVGGKLVVPDLAHDIEPMSVPLAREGGEMPLHKALMSAESVLADAAHTGLREVGSGWAQRVNEVASGLREVGFNSTAGLFTDLVTKTKLLSKSFAQTQADAAVNAWLTAMIRIKVLSERV